MRLKHKTVVLAVGALLFVSTFAAVPVAAQPQADLSVGVSASTVSPGEAVTVTYTLANVGDEDGNATSIKVEQLPDNWTVSSQSGDWQSDSSTWLSLSGVQAGGQYQVEGTVQVPENASEGTYAVNASGNVAPEVSDTATATIEVSSFSTADYDTDGDGTVTGDRTGVLQALADFNSGELDRTQILQILAEFNG